MISYVLIEQTAVVVGTWNSTLVNEICTAAEIVAKKAGNIVMWVNACENNLFMQIDACVLIFYTSISNIHCIRIDYTHMRTCMYI